MIESLKLAAAMITALLGMLLIGASFYMDHMPWWGIALLFVAAIVYAALAGAVYTWVSLPSGRK